MFKRRLLYMAAVMCLWGVSVVCGDEDSAPDNTQQAQSVSISVARPRVESDTSTTGSGVAKSKEEQLKILREKFENTQLQLTPKELQELLKVSFEKGLQQGKQDGMQQAYQQTIALLAQARMQGDNESQGSPQGNAGIPGSMPMPIPSSSKDALESLKSKEKLMLYQAELVGRMERARQKGLQGSASDRVMMAAKALSGRVVSVVGTTGLTITLSALTMAGANLLEAPLRGPLMMLGSNAIILLRAIRTAFASGQAAAVRDRLA